MQVIENLSDLALRFDALLVDIWGVVHNGRAPFPNAVDACRRFRAERGPVVLISNSPRPARDIPEQFAGIGVPDDFYDAIVTSGEVTRAALAARAPGPAFKLGPARDDRIYEGLGLEFAELEAAAFISCTGLFDDETEGPDDYAELLDAARARDLEMVCANPDIVVMRGPKKIFCAGALAEAYAALGGAVVLCGKPHPPIYEAALDALPDAASPIDPARVLAIGDGPDTDLAGAQERGFATLFIARGIHEEDVTADGRLEADAAGAFLAGRGRRADYAALELAW